MDMPFDHCLSDQGVAIEDLALVMESDDFSIPTTEELAAAMNINPIFNNDASVPAFGSTTGADLKIPSVLERFNMGVGPAEGQSAYEAHFNQYPGRTNNWNSVMAGHSVVSNVSTLPLPSVLLQYPQESFQVQQQQCIPHKLESWTMWNPPNMHPPTTATVEGGFMVSEEIYPWHHRYHKNAHAHVVDSVDLFRGGGFSNLADIKCSSGLKQPPTDDDEYPCVSIATEYPVRRVSAKTSGSTTDHILAERKRRERLNQRFIALSAVIPGLTKLDKASVLDDAVKYLKHLQERLSVLEQAQTPNKNVQSVVYVNRSLFSSEDDKASSKENFTGKKVDDPVRLSTPEIEVRVVHKNFLVRIHCEKRKGLLVKSIGELEKLRLTVVDASILSFTQTAVYLTLNGQIEEESKLTVTDIVKALHDLFKRMS